MIGQTVSHYRIVEEVGRGGMGVVYKAEDVTLHRPVALKFLPPEMTRDPAAKRRFVHEAQAASALDHPNIAVVHEIDETDDGRSFICMAYYEGETLKDRLKGGPLKIPEVLNIALQISEGLQRAHEAGIVHRDIKPSNVVVTARGEVKLLDFGLAKLASDSHTSQLRTHAGTAAYMSPEHIRDGVAEPTSDLFSLGVVTYEMATGHLPFKGESEPALFYSILNTEPLPPSELRSEIPIELNGIILRLLDKDPDRRYHSAAELATDLRKILGFEGALPLSVSGLSKASRLKLGIGTLAVLSLLVVTLLVLPGRMRKWLPSHSGEEGIVLVVLPFNVVGETPTDKAFADGLIEVLTSKLTELGRLQERISVIPQMEVRSRTIRSASDAMKMFGVTHVVSGSLQRNQNELRLTLNVYDASTLRQLNSTVVDQHLTSASLLQDNIFDRLARLLDFAVDANTMLSLASPTTQVPGALDLCLQARGYQQQKDFQKALESYQMSLRADSLYLDAYSGMGQVYEAMKDFSRAESLYKKMAGLRPTSWLARNRLGAFYVRRGNFDAAVQEFEHVIDLNPNVVYGYNNLGGVLTYTDKWKEAKDMFERSLSVQPNSVAYSNLGTGLFFQDGCYSDAARMFERALRFNSRDCRLWANLGAAYYWSEDERSWAGVAYAKAIELGEDQRRNGNTDPRLIVQLADCYAMTNKPDSATALLALLVDQGPSDPGVMAKMSETYEELGMRELALEWIKKALENGYPLWMIEKTPGLQQVSKDPGFSPPQKDKKGG